MSAKHSNISIFVPHIGCPNKCSFCNQHYISGKVNAPMPRDIINAVEIAKNSKNYNPETFEIAFFGGSFTAIDRDYMLELLETAFKFVKEHSVSGIRISTRPDAINDEILKLLKSYGVTAIEIGAQSLDDEVLSLNERGHKAEAVFSASKLIKSYGFNLGLQIMTGLYGDNDTKLFKTANKCLEIKPDTIRIYPTIVLKNTHLAELYESGVYEPQKIEEAVKICSKLYTLFTENNIKVIRLGLHTIDETAFVAGPWHPAFSELCQSEIFLNNALNKLKTKGNYSIFVNKSDVSKMIGQKKSNIIKLENSGFYCKVFADKNIKPNEIKIKREVNN